MSDTIITAYQQYWLKHIRAAEDFDGRTVNYARSVSMTLKKLYSWHIMTLARKRGLPSIQRVRS